MATYKIIRFFRKEGRKQRVIKRGLTLAEARRHTNDPKTMKAGEWFDGFSKE